MSQIKPTGRALTLPLLAQTGQLIVLGTVVTYGSMRYKEASRFLGDTKAHRVVKQLEEAGWLRNKEGVLTFTGTNDQLQGIQALVRWGYSPVAEVRDRVEKVEPGSSKRVLVFGSFAARLAGKEGNPPGDVDVLIVSDDVQADREGLAMAVEDYSPTGQLELHTIVRSRGEIENGVWFDELNSKPWIALSDLPVGEEATINCEGNTEADVSALFTNTVTGGLLTVLLTKERVSLSEASEVMGVHRTSVARAAKSLQGWVSVSKEATVKWVSLNAPREVKEALTLLLPSPVTQGLTLLEAGASEVWAYGEYADWVRTRNGDPPRVQLVAVNEKGWTPLDVNEILGDGESKVLLCDKAEWDEPRTRAIRYAKNGVTVLVK